MELHNGFGTVSTLHCDLFASPVVFNILLQLKKINKNKRRQNIFKNLNDKKKKPHTLPTAWRVYLQLTSEQLQDAPGRSSSQTWGAHPCSSVFSADDHQDSQTSYLEEVHLCCLQSVGDHCCNY